MIAESYGKSWFSCVKNCQTISLSGHFAFPLTMKTVPVPFTFQDIMTYYLKKCSYCTVLVFFFFLLWRLIFSSQHSLLLSFWSHIVWSEAYIPLCTEHFQYASVEVPLLPKWYRSQFSLCILKQSFLFDSILLCRNKVEVWD